MGSDNNYCCCRLNVGVIVAASLTLAYLLISIVLGFFSMATIPGGALASLIIGVIFVVACILAIVGAAKEIWGMVIPYCIAMAVLCVFTVVSIISFAVVFNGKLDTRLVPGLAVAMAIYFILLALALWALSSASAYVHQTRTRGSFKQTIY